MSRVLPYPFLTVGLILMWLLLTSFSLGQLILGTVVALAASRAMEALTPARPRFRRWTLIPKLFGIIFIDIVRSNYAVAALILTNGRHGKRQSGMIEIKLQLRDPSALAILAVVLTATPGTAWLGYDQATGTLLMHVFDLVEEHAWQDTITNRYEHLLMEIFE